MTKKEKTQLEIVIAKLDILLDRSTESIEKTGINYTEFSEHGGIRIKEVDQLITNKLLSGDQLWKQVAEETNEYHTFIAPDSNFSEDVTNQIEANQTRAGEFAARHGQHITNMVKMLPMYKHKSGKVSWHQVSGFQLMMGGWEKIKKRQLHIIPNHSVVANGNYTRPDSNTVESWKTNLRDMIPQWVEEDMIKRYALLKGTT